MALRVIPVQAEDTHKIKADFIENRLKARSYTISDDVFGCNIEYIINGIVFKENIKVDTFREFEVYRVTMDDYADTSGVSIDDDTYLQLTLEPAPYGVIINSNVYLTHQQWNTVMVVSEGLLRCAVCDVYCDVTEHVETSVHVDNMGRYRPLNKYDLTITRKINNNYHCGVCNTLFDQSLKNDHLSSKTHEDKLLFAINKVSDIMYDYNIHNNNDVAKKDSYHFNAKAINNNNIPDESSDSEESEEDEYSYNDQWNPFNALKYNDDGDYEEPVQSLEFSYASMAKKPKTDDLPEVLEVDLGNKKVTVKFNSWNMLIRPMPNRVYCMACKQLEHARRAREHCGSEQHLQRLRACAVVERYDKYFVRQVDEKCYHCGHCNNLQVINDMEDHIASHHTHPTSMQLLDTPATKISSPIKTNPKHDEIHDQSNDVAKLEANKIKHFNVTDMYEALKLANSNFEDIVICIYGRKLRISKLAYNIVCQGEHDFYCGLCELNIRREHLKLHVNDAQHLTRLQRTPFIEAFNVHLFREIRDALHCALCNELVQLMPQFILKHKYLEKHIVSLNRALDCIKDNIAEVNNGAIANTAAEISKIPNTGDIAKLAAEISNITNNGAIAKTAAKISKIPNTGDIAKLAAEISNITNNGAIAKTAAKISKIPNTGAIAKHAAEISKIPNTGAIARHSADISKITNNGAIAAEISKTTNSATNKATIETNNVNTTNNAMIKNNVALNAPADNIPNVSALNEVNTTAYITAAKEHPKDAKVEGEAQKDNEADRQIVAQTQAENEEFIAVKNGVKGEIPDELDDSFDDFDFEEHVYVKLGNSYIKITNKSYNTLVDVGDGAKYCFVCSSLVGELGKHVESRGHMDNMEKIKFVDKYNEDLLRQLYLMYHCSICNVVITRKQLTHHLAWPTHALQTENTKISSKKRKNEIKSGVKQIAVTTQKENIYLNGREADIKVYLNIRIEKEMEVERMNKIVILDDNVLKVSHECWHSVSEAGDGFRCKVCQCEFDASELGVHVSSEGHKGNLDKIEKQYSPALIRKINDTTLNCVICNTEVANKKHIVTEHIQGKKHVKHYEAVLKESSVANTYADCDQDVLMP